MSLFFGIELDHPWRWILSPGGLSATAGLKEEQKPPGITSAPDPDLVFNSVLRGKRNEVSQRCENTLCNTGSDVLWRTTFIDLQFAVVLLPEAQA